MCGLLAGAAKNPFGVVRDRNLPPPARAVGNSEDDQLNRIVHRYKDGQLVSQVGVFVLVEGVSLAVANGERAAARRIWRRRPDLAGHLVSDV